VLSYVVIVNPNSFVVGVLLWVKFVRNVFLFGFIISLFSVQEMFAVKVPWKGLDAASIIIAVVKKNMRLKIPPTCDPVVTRIINSVWKQNPDKRLLEKSVHLPPTLTPSSLPSGCTPG